MTIKTIIMVTNNYTPYAGGVVSSVQVTVDELRRQGHRVIIVTLDFLGNHAAEFDLIRLYCPLRFRYRGNYMAIPWRMQHQMQEIFKKYQPDVVHVHHPFLLGVAAQRCARALHIPVVFTYHTLYEHYLHYVPLPAVLTRPLLFRAVDEFCKRVDTIIVPSNSVQQQLAQRAHASQVLASAIRPCYALPAVALAKSEALAKEGVSSCTAVAKSSVIIELLCVSRFTHEKNLTFLCDVLKLLGSTYRLTLIGYGEQQKQLEQYAYETLHLSRDQFRCIVRPPRAVIADWYKQADLFVFASTTETQGLVLAEAMAAGTPVIALRGPGVVDIVHDGVNGYIVDSVHEMAQKICHVMTDDPLYQVLCVGAQRTAQQYHPEHTVQKLLQLYDNVIKDKTSDLIRSC